MNITGTYNEEQRDY